MKQLLLTLAIAGAASLPAGASTPMWLRDVAISPDGTTIAFTFKGDIYTVPTQGGRAYQLTTNKAYDSKPVWTPDGKRIAFRSNRDGSDDIFVMPAVGGTAVRLTTSAASELPMAFLDNSRLLMQMNGEPTTQSVRWPGYTQTYVVDINKPGQRPELYLPLPMTSASASKSGILYGDRKGVENIYRKHERSSATRDIWLYNNGKYTKLTDFNGHDVDPVWSGENSFFYVSEEDGTLNVWKRDLDGSNKKQLTSFKKHPVRSLSASNNGQLAFSWDGEVYTMKEGGQPQKVVIDIVGDDYDNDLVKRIIRNGATSWAVSPSGEEVAFVVRGDIYVTSTKYKTTRRITNTPAQERSLDFSPDGKSLVYDSDRDGYWQLFIAKAKDPDTKLLCYAEEIVEEPLYKCSTAAQQPDFSPDGKKVAFLEDRTALRVIDVKSKKVNTALDGKFNYSYSDGDVSFEWSPDSKWLIADYIGIGGWNNKDIALVKADGSEVIDLTESGYTQSGAKWVMNGKGVAYQTSKYGMRSHGSWGEEGDIVVMMLDADGWDLLNMTEEELALKEEADKAAKANKDSKDKKGAKKEEKEAKKEEPKDLNFDLDNRQYRIKRLTRHSGNYHDYYLTPKGDKLYYTTSATEGGYNLYVTDLKKGDTRLLSRGVFGSLMPDKDGKNLFVGGMRKVSLPGGQVTPIEFEAIYDRKPSLEREYMYDHMLRQVHDKFYDVKLHGVDWKYYGDHYRKFLPYINNNRDFSDLLSEILGELNASHTGSGARTGGASLPNAYLGALYDNNYSGEGLKVAEIIKGGPLSDKRVGIAAGDIITAIDGEKIAPKADYNSMLEGKAGRKTLLSVKKADGSVKTVSIKPISMGTLSGLVYQRWVDRNAAIVDSVSGGRIGYVHIQGMNSPSFRETYEKALGKYRNCDAIVIDTRHNGGGWLHNDVALLFSGKAYSRFMPRGRYIGTEPFSQWTKPSAMLVNESNYSDAHGTPYAYQTLGIGEVIGAPIPGTMTAVWWETQIDPEIYFGIPQVTNVAPDGTILENHQLEPDVIIYNDPADLEKGYDAQLVGATKRLLEQTKKGKK